MRLTVRVSPTKSDPFRVVLLLHVKPKAYLGGVPSLRLIVNTLVRENTNDSNKCLQKKFKPKLKTVSTKKSAPI